jgi:hypothetical protein
MTEDPRIEEIKQRARDGDLTWLERMTYRALLLALRRQRPRPPDPGGETRATDR